MKQHFVLKTAAQNSVAFVVEKHVTGYRVTCGEQVFEFSHADLHSCGPWIRRVGQDLFISSGSLQRVFECKRVGDATPKADGAANNQLAALFPGKVTKINVRVGDLAKAQDVVVVMESMKMEYAYQAPEDIRIVKLLVSEGQVLSKGQAFFEFESVTNV